MVLGAKLRTVMSSIIRWRKGETLRAVGMGYPNEVVLLMASNGIGKLSSTTASQSLSHTDKAGLLKTVAATEFPRSGLVQCQLTRPTGLARPLGERTSAARAFLRPGGIRQTLTKRCATRQDLLVRRQDSEPLAGPKSASAITRASGSPNPRRLSFVTILCDGYRSSQAAKLCQAAVRAIRTLTGNAARIKRPPQRLTGWMRE